MDRIKKALNKLSAEEREKVEEILDKLISKQLAGLNLKKLKGRDDVYRVRSGQIRIIYRQLGDKIFVLAIERRNDNTYNL
jgi:mRNA-degrading endonuclease RelE of RelBE toxin-antitoxin system